MPFDPPIGRTGEAALGSVGNRDPACANDPGVDIDAYDLRIDSPAGTLHLDAPSVEDRIRLADLGLSVDLAE